ncbi:MAG: glycosyltransferase family 1 protein [Planctomycetota bacterium]
MTLRIGLDAREGFRDAPRGIGLYCRHLMRELAEYGDELHVVAYHERPIPPDMPPLAANIEPKRVEMKGSRLHLWEKVRIPLQIRADRIDVYHGTYNTIPPRFVRWRAPALLVTLHDVVMTWWDGDPPGIYGEHMRRVTPRVCRQADRILTVSEFSKRDICQRFGVEEERVEVFHNGIPPALLRDPAPGTAEQARQRFAQGQPYVFTIGSPTVRKNTRGIIRALGRLKQTGHLRHRAVITGLQPADRQMFAAFAEEHGLLEDVDLHGYLTVEDVAAVYAGADLTIYASFAEGWGIPIVESLSMGTPVVTSNTTSMPEAGRDHVRYFDPSDLDEMTQVIGAALDDLGALAVQREAGIQYGRGFTWRAAVERTVAVYRSLAAARR